ncbi:hypothetical protein JCM8208_004330 [Rhodotorula glutinis]
MSMRGRLASPFLVIAVGVGSGIWIFRASHSPSPPRSPADPPSRPLAEPLLESYKDSTHGSFRPEDDAHTAPVPPLPGTSLQPGKTKDGEDLRPPPAQEVPMDEPVRKV